MNKNNNFVDDKIIEGVAMLLAGVCISYSCVGLISRLGQNKTFMFIIGVVAMAAAIAYGFLTARSLVKSGPFLITIFFFIALIYFARAAGFIAMM